MISTRLTKLAKYSKALSLPPLSSPLLSVFHLCASVDHQFPLSFFYPSCFFFYLRSCVCVRVFFSLPRPPHPDCVRVTRASFPLLRRQPPTLKFLQSLVPVSTLVLCFSFAGFFRFTLFSLSLSGFTRARATVWLGWRAVCRYLQRSWSEGILNVCGGNLGFDLFFIGEHFWWYLLLILGIFFYRNVFLYIGWLKKGIFSIGIILNSLFSFYFFLIKEIRLTNMIRFSFLLLF